MEETKEQQSIHHFLQFAIYLSVATEILLFIYGPKISDNPGHRSVGLLQLLEKMGRIIIYKEPVYSKLFTLVLIFLVSIGTLSKKDKDLNPKNAILYPFIGGISITLLSLWLYGHPGPTIIAFANGYELGYMACTLCGTILLHIAMDNVSKIISSNLGKDKWNVEGESFNQRTKPKPGPYTINIPTLFYYKKKVHKGYIVLENIFRGVLLVGTPGSGKSFSIVMPVIRQLLAKEFTMLLYDFKFPDLGKVAYYNYLLAKQQGKCKNHQFHVINLTDPEKSRRINPWRSEYLRTLAEASETAEGLVEAMKKGDKSGGSDQFFTQSAVNFLAACIYFFSKHEKGRYSSFPHVLAFLNAPYEDIFNTLFSNKELSSLLSPFMTAYKARAFDQLEGQVGTLKIFISRLATKETFWVFSGDDFNLKITDPMHPGILVLANDPSTQSINSACYSVVLNRVTRLINSKGNLPIGLLVDEAPSIFIFRISELIAQARSNMVGTLLGIQSLQQLQQQYGKDTAATLTSVVGNILSGAVQNKDTLEWLERVFGKVKQMSESLSIDRSKTSLSLSEKLEPLIPAGKIASLKAGEMVGILASDAVEKYTGIYETTAVNCRVNLNLAEIKKEESAYKSLPVYYDFKGKQDEILMLNYNRITSEVQDVIKVFRTELPTPEPLIQQSKGSMSKNSKK